MTEPLPDVWTTRDLPMLREVTRRIDAGEHAPLVEDLAAAAGLTEEDGYRAAAALVRRGFIEGVGAAELPIIRVTEVSGQAYLVTGLHPDGADALSRLVSALQQAAEQSGDEETAGRLRRAADSMLSLGRDVGAGVLTAVLTAAVT